MDCIRLTGIDVYAYHGALAAEKELGQRFVIDLELWTDVSTAAESDELDDALDYTKVHSRVVELAAGQPCNLIETLANAICAMLLSEFVLEMVSVTVHKPNPPISNFLGSVSVTVERMVDELHTLLDE
ncbi:MAG: dihydroneopterin aldolase [bacterium]|nr:dihydroneopterin aldolase [bacterium]MCP4799778.1 dihydroneopterin aldolase [bacterium]